ncbi:MAG TPA: sulfatase-like hydrolase/transferase [Pirellulales bacterium]|nr:sulfatase-like hydrolase/transferase [Pirellulales bacterium]
MILCDDLGYGDIGCFGHPTIKTPNLDRLASQGARFTDCYSSAPVCSSSRAGLMTGRCPTRSGVYDWISEGNVVCLKQSELTIPTLLKQAGYATCHSGKWHLNGKFNSSAQPQPGDHGFDHWFSTQNNAAPSHENPKNFVRNGSELGPMQGFSCQLVADEAIRWLKDGRAAEKPFFLFVCFHEPHEPVASPPDLVSQYSSAKNPDEAQYFANVANMDRAVGRLMAALDEMKLADNTLVYFSSDNGPETLLRYPSAKRSYGSPGPLRGMKLWLYEAGMRVPGIVRWPGHVKAAQVMHEPVCSLDLLPTCCALAGMQTPTDRAIDGSNIVDLLDGKPWQRQVPLFWHYYHSLGKPKAAMRVGDYVVLGDWGVNSEKGGSSIHPGDSETIKTAKLTEFELYNVHDDLGEQRDLASSEPEKLRELSALLVAKYSEVVAEGPVWTGFDPPTKKAQ